MVSLAALESSASLRYFLYKEVAYKLVSDQAARAGSHESKAAGYGAASGADQERAALATVEFVSAHLDPLGQDVQDKDSWNDLVRGVAWCDQQAWALATLLARQGTEVRLFMLRGPDGSSNHTVAEMRIGDRWVFADPYFGLVLRGPTGRLLSLHEFARDPLVLHAQPRYRRLSPTAQREVRARYHGVFHQVEKATPWKFPSPSQQGFLRRAAATVVRSSVRQLGPSFANFCQDYYLSRHPESPASSQTNAVGLFVRARNYQLFGRSAKAQRQYEELIARFPQSREATDSRFFLGRLYLASGRIANATRLLQISAANAVWKVPAAYHLHAAHARAGRKREAARKLQQWAGEAGERGKSRAGSAGRKYLHAPGHEQVLAWRIVSEKHLVASAGAHVPVGEG